MLCTKFCKKKIKYIHDHLLVHVFLHSRVVDLDILTVFTKIFVKEVYCILGELLILYLLDVLFWILLEKKTQETFDIYSSISWLDPL